MPVISVVRDTLRVMCACLAACEPGKDDTRLRNTLSAFSKGLTHIGYSLIRLVARISHPIIILTPGTLVSVVDGVSKLRHCAADLGRRQNARQAQHLPSSCHGSIQEPRHKHVRRTDTISPGVGVKADLHLGESGQCPRTADKTRCCA